MSFAFDALNDMTADAFAEETPVEWLDALHDFNGVFAERHVEIDVAPGEPAVTARMAWLEVHDGADEVAVDERVVVRGITYKVKDKRGPDESGWSVLELEIAGGSA